MIVLFGGKLWAASDRSFWLMPMIEVEIGILQGLRDSH